MSSTCESTRFEQITQPWQSSLDGHCDLLIVETRTRTVRNHSGNQRPKMYMLSVFVVFLTYNENENNYIHYYVRFSFGLRCRIHLIRHIVTHSCQSLGQSKKHRMSMWIYTCVRSTIMFFSEIQTIDNIFHPNVIISEITSEIISDFCRKSNTRTPAAAR